MASSRATHGSVPGGQETLLVDHPWLLPGEFVVDRSGTIQLAYRYQYREDFPDPRVITTAIQMTR